MFKVRDDKVGVIPNNVRNLKREDEKMEYLITSISLINLGFNTMIDLRRKEVSLTCCGICSLAALLARMLLLRQGAADVILALLPGAFLVLTVIISGGMIGMGDALVFVSLGFAEDVMVVIMTMLAGMCISAMFSLCALALGRVGLKSRLPMMPFVLTAYVLIIILRRIYG